MLADRRVRSGEVIKAILTVIKKGDGLNAYQILDALIYYDLYPTTDTVRVLCSDYINKGYLRIDSDYHCKSCCRPQTIYRLTEEGLIYYRWKYQPQLER